jgi:hypothetical protein
MATKIVRRIRLLVAMAAALFAFVASAVYLLGIWQEQSALRVLLTALISSLVFFGMYLAVSGICRLLEFLLNAIRRKFERNRE